MAFIQTDLINLTDIENRACIAAFNLPLKSYDTYLSKGMFERLTTSNEDDIKGG